ncbi:MAG: carboxypeptidase-like regulatory domain-containing protein [Balneolaceae bacterium]
MIKSKTHLIFSLCLVLLGSRYSYSQDISGQIKESKTGTPVTFVNIGIVGKDIGTVSNVIGNFTLDISDATNQDTLRFSFIGFESINLSVETIRSNGFTSPVLMEKKVFELDEVFVESGKLVSETLGVRRKDGFPIPLYRRAKTDLPFPQQSYRHEIGTLFKSDGPVYLDKVQINFSDNRIDTLDLRVNVYSLQGGEFRNVLKEPVYLQITDSKNNRSPLLDLSKFNLFLEHDFLISIENYKRIPNNSVRIFANLKSKGRKFPTYYRSNSQSDWTNLKVKSKDFGLSIQAHIKHDQ